VARQLPNALTAALQAVIDTWSLAVPPVVLLDWEVEVDEIPDVELRSWYCRLNAVWFPVVCVKAPPPEKKRTANWLLLMSKVTS
jgi:hypothetical protein